MSISLLSTPKIRRSGNRLTVDLGEMDFVDADALSECSQRLENLLAEYNAVIVMNLEGVKIIGAAILGHWLSLRQRGWEVRLTNVSPFVREVLSVTRLDTLFAVVESTA
jgi:anti-anti-sigma factor